MIRSYAVEAIVLSRRNVGEADKFITFYTKEFGKKQCLAKGVRKLGSTRAAFLEPFSHVRALIAISRQREILTEVFPVTTHELLRSRLERLSMAYVGLELIERLTVVNEPQLEVFDLLQQFLFQLNTVSSSRKDSYARLLFFKQQLLILLGFSTPNVKEEQADQLIEQVLESRLRSTQLLTDVVRAL